MDAASFRKIRLLFLIVFSVSVLSCEKRELKTEEGTVRFTLEGAEYKFENMVLSARANPTMWESKNIVKKLVKGKKDVFEFALEAGKYKGIAKKDNTFSAAWKFRTDNPQGASKERMYFANKDVKIIEIGFNVYLSDWWVKSPDGGGHDCWIIVDKFDGGRAKGRFGGNFELNSLENSELGKKSQIEDGAFDVPFRKFYEY